MLCESLQVSAHTLGVALAGLVAEGVLASDGPRRRLRIAQPPPALPPALPAPEPATHRVLCLSREPLHEMPRMGLEFLSYLRTWLPQMDLRHHPVTFDGSRKPRKAWDKLLELERPQHLLVIEGSHDLAQWASARGVKTVFLGGETRDTGIPMVGGAIGHLLLNLLDELIALGHHRICLPLLGRNAGFAESLRRLAGQAMAKADLPLIPSYHLPTAAGDGPDVMWRVLDDLAAAAMPTAMIFLMWDQFLAAHCYFSARNLHIPADISAVLIGGGSSNSWFRPRLTHSVYPAADAAEIVARWISEGLPAENTTIHLPMKIVRGESVAPPPRK
jgi:DNA-binding LacI/PurR family transcriptional regulator